ncbi:formin-binding protein 4-like isoform X1 [Hylaeus volcanicus]|uniref:formin-binding protein 4-like isoform X1 n=1 Tax=Hylaeus volcanicus TaxID=313075 RepID=UPI0023B77CB4|nr:formin-binding protein 4-like isoform X1 [Hylaeus volcanicus]
MKRRQRRPVLELNQAQTGSHGEHVQNKRKQVTSDYSGQHVPANPLANLLCHYNSDSDNEDAKKDVCKLDDQVNNFLKEIQLIAPKQPLPNDCSNSTLTPNSNTHSSPHMNQQAMMWRECIDESSGYPYYWHIETNEVTWEIPEELRYLKNNVKSNSVVKPLPMQEPHWVDFSSAAYQQSHENIPEGMIPREVVVRNRNRYICNETTQKREHQADQDIANASDNESDDGKIEMITSYGSDESDSDTIDENHSKNRVPSASATESTNVSSMTKPKNVETYSPAAPATQLQLPTASQSSDKDYDDKDTAEGTKIEASLNSKSIEEAKYLKTQESEEYTSKASCDNRAKKCSNKHNVNSDLDFRISLVPGYDEDSDVEEESEVKQERKALFPIPQTDVNTETASLSRRNIQNKHSILDDGQAMDSNDSDSNVERKIVQQQDNESASEGVDCGEEPSVKPEDKLNKFLENLHGRSKCFQRKKRIAFDVPLTKAKVNDDSETKTLEVEDQQEEANSCDNTERDDESRVNCQEEQNTQEDTTENVDSREESSNIEELTNTPSEPPADSKEDEVEVNQLSQIVLEKLKFLSEGKPTVSPVQMMLIQLQTLFVAWEGGCLEKSYLSRWLTDTSHELERLEQDAAPPGWLCQWDRSHKRYYYQNTTTGITQWTYPDTGIAGGAEEMEICSTPPPIDQEEMVIPAAEEDEGLKSKPKKSQESSEPVEDAMVLRNCDVEAPPPPQISNPSPPPPPRIYANDLKKDRRKRDNSNDILNSKKQRLGEEGPVIAEMNQLENPSIPIHSSASLSPQTTNLANVTNVTNVTNVEPLPPGVDLTEAPYELPATALKRILYSAVQPQGGALYEATARDPTVPILGHPAALVQEHYLQYPAYHQHLHSTAALVLPHKHGVQPAIQLIPDYTPLYTNHKVIEKPPVKTAKESLVSALDSFYSDIARIESSGPEKPAQRQDILVMEPSSLPIEETSVDAEQDLVEPTTKEKKRKKTRVGISKKHKEVSSMVAKWQKVQQNFENT